MVIQFITKRIQICLAASRKHGFQIKITLRNNSEE